MIYGKTPFYDKNRKLMFYRIINTAPTFPPAFSDQAVDIISGLLTVKEEDRLGSVNKSGVSGAAAIKSTAFFSTIDFDALLAKEIAPPFVPEVVNEFDTKYVPKAYLQVSFILMI